ncbi:DUF6090 family protein [Seonamhaeicola sp. MEBiC1930]|uniref:DUF6090 family protein n=1 Tax=Seonamhaeicola sp. MEBiC01930 TaxID=2976768 RepID=UPI0032511E15
MIKFFRRIRQKLLAENRFSKYLLYAIGEIILVVIGILIALQINNWNEIKKQRERELHYLSNIKKDLILNLNDLDSYISKRESQVKSAKNVIEYHDGKPLTDLVNFNIDCINVYTWQKFNLNSNAFTELVSSGNLALISNDSIKNYLLDLESMNQKLKYTEEHFRYDSEQLLYGPVYSKLDMNPTVENFVYQVSNGNAGKNVEMPRENFELLLKSLKHKNGMSMAVYELGVMQQRFEEMKNMCNRLIRLIDKEVVTND